MSYSPFAVLGTQIQIQKNREKTKKYHNDEQKKDIQQKIDYTEMFRKKYFPHLIEK